MIRSHLRNLFRLSVLAVTISLTLSGCASITMPTLKVPYSEGINVSDITASAVIAFQDKGFAIQTVNDNIGLVTTEWKDITSGGEIAAEAVFGILNTLAGDTSNSYTADEKRLKLTLIVDKSNNIIRIKPIKQYTENSRLSPLQDSDKLMLNEITQSILSSVGGTARIIWEETRN